MANTHLIIALKLFDMTTYSLFEFINPVTPDKENKLRLDKKTKKKFCKYMHKSRKVKRYDMASSSNKRAKDIIHQIKRIKQFNNYNIAWIRFESNESLTMDEMAQILDLFEDFGMATYWHKSNPELIEEILCVSIVLMKL